MQTSLRWIQLEARLKNFMGAKNIFEQCITYYKDHTQILAFILVEYSEFLKTVYLIPLPNIKLIK